MNKYAQVYFNTYFAKLAKMAPPPSPPPPVFKPGPNHINRPTGAPSPTFPPRVINKEPLLAMLPELPEEHPVLPPDPTQTGLNKEQLAEQKRRFNNPPIPSTFLANLSPPPPSSSVSSVPSASAPSSVSSVPSASASGQIAKPLSNQTTAGSTEALRPKTKADLIKNWSTYHGKRNSFNPNSSADKAMLDAMVDAKINGKSVVAVADGPLSRPAMRPARR